MKKIYVLTLSVTLLGFGLRYYNLDLLSLHRDEAFLGYNAYSLLLTGREMSGDLLPLHLKSFIYSPGMYSYFSIPFIYLFDLSAATTRMASVIFGSLSIPIIYIFTRRLFEKNKHKETIALLSTILFAINPWHINLSRTATENTIVVFFILCASFIYVAWSKKNENVLLLLAYICFAVTITLYQAPRAFVPMLIPILFTVFSSKTKKNIFKNAVLYLLLIVLPLAFILTSEKLSLRINTVSVFSSQETQLKLEEQIREEGVQQTNPIITRSFHNKPVYYSKQFLENYFIHLSYNFFFTDNAFPDRYRVPNTSLLFILQLPLIIAGIWFMLNNEQKKAMFFLAWMLLSPVGSALAFDDIPNMQRTLFILPAILTFSAYGLAYIVLSLKKRKLAQRAFTIIVVLVFTFEFSMYLRQYHLHAPVYRPWYRHDGYKELIQKVNHYSKSYEKTVITDRESAPTIFFLFFNKYDPRKFQSETMNKGVKDYDRVSFGNISFTQEQCPVRQEKNGESLELLGEKDTLYVNSALCDIPKHARLIETIKRKDNSEVFHILEIKN